MTINQSWVSVAEVLARQVPVHSSEAVAVLAELCAVLRARGEDVIPDITDVLINGEGRLSIRSWDRSASDPAALGRMLHSLLATAPAPAVLRLLATNAISSERFRSISAFAEALTSYERADRHQLIQAVHDRWVAMPPDAPSTISTAPQRESQSDGIPDPKRQPGTRRARWWASAAAVAVTVAGASAWVSWGKPLSLRSVASSAPTIVLSLPTAIQNAFPWLGGGSSGNVAAQEPEIDKTARARRVKARIATPRDRAIRVVEASTTAGEKETIAGSASTAPATDDDADRSEVLDDPVAAVQTVDLTVYSSAFPEVSPPIMVTRQIARPETFEPGVDASSTVELLVDESGNVERVRLLSRPSPLVAAMMLSAAKTWSFRPALNDGRPVKYRLLLDVLLTQP